jgi:hypothetical protein
VPARQYLLQALPVALEVLNVYSEAQREGYDTVTRSAPATVARVRARSIHQVAAKRLSEKSLGGLWSVGFSGATLQKQALCAPFQQFVRSSVREFENSQTVSQGAFSETQLPIRCLLGSSGTESPI